MLILLYTKLRVHKRIILSPFDVLLLGQLSSLFIESTAHVIRLGAVSFRLFFTLHSMKPHTARPN